MFVHWYRPGNPATTCRIETALSGPYSAARTILLERAVLDDDVSPIGLPAGSSWEAPVADSQAALPRRGILGRLRGPKVSAAPARPTPASAVARTTSAAARPASAGAV